MRSHTGDEEQIAVGDRAIKGRSPGGLLAILVVNLFGGLVEDGSLTFWLG